MEFASRTEYFFAAVRGDRFAVSATALMKKSATSQSGG
jgi:hypothetical protein